MGTIWIEGQFKSLAKPVKIISEQVETKKACILLEDNKKSLVKNLRIKVVRMKIIRKITHGLNKVQWQLILKYLKCLLLVNYRELK